MLTKQKDLEVRNFDSNERLQLEIAKQIQDKYRAELDQLRLGLEDAVQSYDKMQKEFDNFLNEKDFEGRYDSLIRMEPGVYSTKIIDELLFLICHAGADNIRAAVMMRKRKSDGSVF